MRTSTYSVTGLAGGDGVALVIRHVSALDDVACVDVQLCEEGWSEVRVLSNESVPAARIRGAIRQAGFDVTGPHNEITAGKRRLSKAA